ILLVAVTPPIILVVHLLLQDPAAAGVLVVLLGRGQLVAVVVAVQPGLGSAALAFLGEVAFVVVGVVPRPVGLQFVLVARGRVPAAVGAVAGAVQGVAVAAVARQLVGRVIAVGAQRPVVRLGAQPAAVVPG